MGSHHVIHISPSGYIEDGKGGSTTELTVDTTVHGSGSSAVTVKLVKPDEKNSAHRKLLGLRKRVASSGSKVQDASASGRFLIPSGLAVGLFMLLGVVAMVQIEGFSWLDSFYMISITLATVGYGDLYPVTDGGKAFMLLYILIGYAALGGFMTVVTEHLFTQTQLAAKRRLKGMHLGEEAQGYWAYYGQAWVATGLAAVALGVMTIVFDLLDEGMDLLDAAYFSVVSLTTVGYGDLHPHTPAGKVFASLWVVVGTTLTLNALAKFVGAYVRAAQDRKRDAELHRELSGEALEDIDEDGDGQISIAEFVLFKIEKMGLVDEEQINRIAAEFERYDRDGDMKIDDRTVQLLRQNSLKKRKAMAEVLVEAT